VDKFPQQNSTVQDSAFSYRLVVENMDYLPFSQLNINTNSPGPSPLPADVVQLRTDYAREAALLQTNLHDFRLTFRWPLQPSGAPGNGRQTFRFTTSGSLMVTNNWRPLEVAPIHLFFVQPSTFVQAGGVK